MGLFKQLTKFIRRSCIQTDTGHNRGAAGPEKGACCPAPHFPAHFLGQWRTEVLFSLHTDTCWSVGGQSLTSSQDIPQTISPKVQQEKKDSLHFITFLFLSTFKCIFRRFSPSDILLCRWCMLAYVCMSGCTLCDTG